MVDVGHQGIPSDRNHSSAFSILPALSLGIKDSINPYAVSVLIIYLLCITYFGKTDTFVKISWKYFVLAVFTTLALSVAGELDGLIGQPAFLNVIGIVNLILGFVYMGLGGALFVDWWRMNKGFSADKLLLQKPVYLDLKIEKQEHRSFLSRLNFLKHGKIKLTFIVLGVFAAILASAWPVDKDLYVMWHYFIKGRQAEMVSGSLLLYTLGLIWPLLLLRAFLQFVFHKNKENQSVVQSMSLFNIISSAILLGIGLSMIYLHFT